MQKSDLTPLQAALDARDRAQQIRPLPFYSDSAGNGSVAIRVPTVREELRAQLEAAKWLQGNSAGVPADMLEGIDPASLWIVYDSFLQPEKRPGAKYASTAFLTPDHMLSKLTADEIGYCVELLNEVREEFMARPEAWDDDAGDDWADALANVGDEAADAMLADKPRAWLIDCVKFLAKR